MGLLECIESNIGVAVDEHCLKFNDCFNEEITKHVEVDRPASCAIHRCRQTNLVKCETGDCFSHKNYPRDCTEEHCQRISMELFVDA